MSLVASVGGEYVHVPTRPEADAARGLLAVLSSPSSEVITSSGVGRTSAGRWSADTRTLSRVVLPAESEDGYDSGGGGGGGAGVGGGGGGLSGGSRKRARPFIEVVALVFPRAKTIIQTVGLTTLAVLYTIMLAASASFSTPMRHTTNLLIDGLGGYVLGTGACTGWSVMLGGLVCETKLAVAQPCFWALLCIIWMRVWVRRC